MHKLFSRGYGVLLTNCHLNSLSGRHCTGLPSVLLNAQYHQEHFNSEGPESPWRKHKWSLAAGVGSLIAGYFLVDKSWNFLEVSAAAAATKRSLSSGSIVDNKSEYPIISTNEVSNHYSLDKGVWVTYKGGVYDVTDFVPQHPGGSRLLMAAGSSLEPFWDLYPVHQTPEVLKTLEKYRIGTLPAHEKLALETENAEADAFVHDPKRHPGLLRRSQKPFNAETHPGDLTYSFYTPSDIFYVRNHLPVPQVDIESFGLEVTGLKLDDVTLSMEEIKKLPKVHISSTIQCAGNRREDMNRYKPVSGLSWTGGAIGNARWSGARLMDVLKLAGFVPENYPCPGSTHIVFDGLDSDPSGESYGASIPLTYLLDKNFEAVVAYEMNGDTLPRDHGYPLRIILPGVVGARNVKWLGRITISPEESQSPWQQRDYKVFNTSVNLSNVDYRSSPAIIDMPLNSYICSHEDNSNLHLGPNSIKGYAYTGGNRKIVRVELSTDRGKTWTVANFMNFNENGKSSSSWVLWEKDLTFSEPGEVEIWVKAVDSTYNQQVESYAGIWNYRGLLPFAYHKVKCQVKA